MHLFFHLIPAMFFQLDQYSPWGSSKTKKITKLWVGLLGLFILTACSYFGVPTPEPDQKTPVIENELQATATPVATPSPTPIPRSLTVCIGSEPDDLFIYSGRTLAKSHIFEAIYDGPIDTTGFGFQPVILEKLPDLAAGDAWIESVPVSQGDWVVNDAGVLVPLVSGQVVRPFGCNQADCAISWGGEPLQMARLSADFSIREGVKWSDGEPMTSSDSIFSYEVARTCQIEGVGACGGNGFIFPRQSIVEKTADYIPLNDRVVRWLGVPGFLDPDYQVNFFIPLPQHLLGNYSLEQLFTSSESIRMPLGWGAYMIEDWQAGEFIRLQANPHYYRAGEGLPKFNQLIFRFVGVNPESNLEALTSGACDLLDQEASQLLAGQEIETTLDFHQQGKIVAHVQAGTVWEQVAFGIQPRSYDNGYRIGQHRPNFFGDTRTRQAMAMCMDRENIIDEIIQVDGSLLDSYIPVIHPLYNPEVVEFLYSPQSGMALLEEVGWVDHDDDPQTPRIAQGIPSVLDGTELSLRFMTSSETQRQQVSNILLESLEGCGIQIELVVLPAEEVYAAGPEGPLFGRQFDLALLAWSTGQQPQCNLFTSDEVMGPPEETWMPLGSPEDLGFIYGWGGLNLTGFSNSEYDNACYEALTALPGQEGYLESHFRAQEIFANELPAVPLFLHSKWVITRPDLTGFILDASVTSELWNIEEFDRMDR